MPSSLRNPEGIAASGGLLSREPTMLLPTLLLPLALLLAPGAAPPGDKTDPKVKLTEKEQSELKKQRDLADAYMRKAAEAALQNLDKLPKDDKLSKAQLESLKVAREAL